MTRFRTGVALDLMTLARLHDRELDAGSVQALQEVAFPACLVLELQSPLAQDARRLLEDAVTGLDTEASTLDELAADFAAIYLTHAFGASPCESVWIDDDGLAMQEPMFEVRDAYARHGLEVPDWRKRPDDHLVLQLHFLAELFDDSELDTVEAAADFLDWHLLRWLPDFARRVASRAATPFYAGLAMLTAAYVDELRDILVEVLGEQRLSEEEITEQLKAHQKDTDSGPAPYVPGVAPSW